MVDLSIIIVSYNTEHFLKQCLLSLEAHPLKGKTVEIIVVDNASKDTSVDMVKKAFPSILVVENKENVGFSKANNIGIKKAKGRYLLFLNSDTEMQEHTLHETLQFLEAHASVGAVTCKVVMPNGEIDDASHRGFPTPWNALTYFSGLAMLFPQNKLMSGYTMGWKGFDTTHEIDACAGAFMMVRRSAGEQIGWWDEDYFFYGEDIDFCYLLKEKGWQIYYLPTVSVLHYKGVSGGIKKISQTITPADKETKLRAKKARFNAMRIFYKKHYTKQYNPFITWFVLKAIDVKEKIA